MAYNKYVQSFDYAFDHSGLGPELIILYQYPNYRNINLGNRWHCDYSNSDKKSQ